MVSVKIITQSTDFARLGFKFTARNDQITQIPSPTLMWVLSGQAGGFIVAYDLWGDFSYKKPRQYINDVLKRYEQTYNCIATQCPATTPDSDNGRRYDLSEIARGLESLKTRCAAFPETKRVYTGREDRLFWTAKEHCEMTIRRGGRFTEFDLKQIILLAGGSYSQAKAKGKAIYKWYKRRGFQGSQRVHTMTREEAARNATKQVVSKNKTAIESAVTSMKLFQEKITAVKVAEITGISRQTCSKYLKEMKKTDSSNRNTSHKRKGQYEPSSAASN